MAEPTQAVGQQRSLKGVTTRGDSEQTLVVCHPSLFVWITTFFPPTLGLILLTMSQGRSANYAIVGPFGFFIFDICPLLLLWICWYTGLSMRLRVTQSGLSIHQGFSERFYPWATIQKWHWRAVPINGGPSTEPKLILTTATGERELARWNFTRMDALENALIQFVGPAAPSPEAAAPNPGSSPH